MTFTERMAAFMATYAIEMPSRSRKYRLFRRVNSKGTVSYYHLGRHGAVRVSSDGTISNSFSVHDTMKVQMELWERKQLESCEDQ